MTMTNPLFTNKVGPPCLVTSSTHTKTLLDASKIDQTSGFVSAIMCRMLDHFRCKKMPVCNDVQFSMLASTGAAQGKRMIPLLSASIHTNNNSIWPLRKLACCLNFCLTTTSECLRAVTLALRKFGWFPEVLVVETKTSFLTLGPFGTTPRRNTQHTWARSFPPNHVTVGVEQEDGGTDTRDRQLLHLRYLVMNLS